MKQYDLYETGALYGQNMSPQKQDALMKYYAAVFMRCSSGRVHDCSIGAGGTTLPMAKLGYEVSGSDLSENLLQRARDNFNEAGFSVSLFQADFTALDECLHTPCDILMSTGNSLPHVDLDGINAFAKAAQACVKPGGHLYFDIRNWDKLLGERPVFIARDPFVMTAERHESLYQIFQWHDDGSVTFLFVTSVDEHGAHIGESATVAPRYYPLRKVDLEQALRGHGFSRVSYFNMDSLWYGGKTAISDTDFETMEWYGALYQRL